VNVKELPQDEAFQRALKIGLEEQDRFKAEPVLAKTGKGYMKSAGVAEIQKIKAKEKVNPLTPVPWRR
jgi:hypothetical protein